MPRPKDAKVWNEDLATALKSRQELSARLGQRQQHTWRKGYEQIVAVRKDIYCFSNGRIVNLPTNLGKTVDGLCRDVIGGRKSILPDGYNAVLEPEDLPPGTNRFDKYPYLKQLKARGGAYAIMMAFHVANPDNLTKDEIIRLAQPFCDEAMEANYMAGRTYGAWKAKDTLKGHGLIIQNGTARYIEGRGFRSQGSHSFQLTRDGQQFLEAMQRKFPDDFARASSTGHPQATTAFNVARRQIPQMHSFGSPSRRDFVPSTASPAGVAQRAGRLGQQDEVELREWVSGARVGETKVFAVGKDRRRHLHNLCDVLESEQPGLKLQHDSHNVSNHNSHRALHIRIHKKGSLSTESSSSVVGWNVSPQKRPMIAIFTGTGHVLGSPATKHARRLPASKAAVEAAETRRAKELSSREEQQSKQHRKNTPSLDSTSEGEALEWAIQQSLREIGENTGVSSDVQGQKSDPNEQDDNMARAIQASLLESDHKAAVTLAEQNEYFRQNARDTSVSVRGSYQSAEDESDRKPAAKRKLFRDHEHEHVDLVDPVPLPKASAKEPIVLDLDGSQDENCLIPVDATPTSRPVSKEEPSVLCLDDSDDDEIIEIDGSSIICIDDSQESISQFCGREDAEKQPSRPQLTIVIDDRERNRNITPRQLRIDLTRLVTAGALNGVWPFDMPKCIVKEERLDLGDFAYVIQSASAGSRKMGIHVERKRVGDLVQRSVAGDHWKQFLRMRDACHHSVFLIEHDTRSSAGFTAYGAQGLEGWNPYSTLIEDEQSIFLFFARALLSSRSSKFIQTRDEQASLRAIGALGLMATFHHVTSAIETSVAAAGDHHAGIKDILQSGGIPWQLARDVARSLGSLKYAKSLYDQCSSERLRSMLLCPVISETNFDAARSSKEGWSDAVYQILTTGRSRASVRAVFDGNKAQVQDHGKFLGALYARSG